MTDIQINVDVEGLIAYVNKRVFEGYLCPPEKEDIEEAIREFFKEEKDERGIE